MKNIFVWNKKSKVHVDVFLKNKQIADFPIDHVSRYLPNWFKKLKPKLQTIENNNQILRSTFKLCDGFQYMLKDTYVLPMWTDFSVTVDEYGRYKYIFPTPDINYGVTEHAPEQTGNSFDPMVHAKLHSPYLLSTKEDIKFHFCQAIWSQTHFVGDLWLPPATVKFTHQMSTHINMFMKRDRQYFFEAGMAMMYIVPMTEKLIEFKTHVLPSHEYDDLLISLYPNKFNNTYKETIRRRNEKGR